MSAHRLGAICIALAGLSCPPVSALAACDLLTGQRVVLLSAAPDPDVLVWDSRARLVAYAAGVIDSAQAVITHTTLAKPGTRAVVAMCDGGAVHPKYVAAAFDAVGIRMTTGPYRGKYGWVVSEDVHPVH